MSSNDPYTSLKAATSLLSAVPYDHMDRHSTSSPSYSTHTDQTVTSTQSAFQIKFALQKLKEGNVYEKSELQRLNHQLQKYLDNVKMLENLNRSLMLEVEKAKQERPLVAHAENKELYSGVETLRGKLEHEQLETVRNKLRIEDSEKLAYYLGERIKFYQSEAERTKAILQSRQQELNHFENERQKLLRGAEQVEGRIRSEQEQQQNAEQEIDKLRAKLREVRGGNHKIDYEIRTMRDMRSFYEHAFKEEMQEYRSRPKGQQPGAVLSANDLNKFYKTELENAISQIRQDFAQLHEQQMKEYKTYKENELALIAKQVEHDRMIAMQTKQRADHTKDLESQSARELQATLEYNRNEMGQLNARYHELTQKLQQLENAYEESRYKKGDRMQQVSAELDQLRYDNDVYAGELDYWERVQRVRLDAEIQAYRSLLNSQFGIVKIQQHQITNSSSSAGNSSSSYHTVRPIDFPKPATTTTEVIAATTATTRPAVVDTAASSASAATTTGVLITSSVRPTDVVTSSTTGPPAVTTASSTVTNNITQTSASSSIVRGASNYDDKTYISDRSNGASDKADTVGVLKQVFDHFDKDKTGKISVSELDRVLTRLNVKLSKESLSKLMTEADRDGNGELTFDEFCRVMLPVFTGRFQDDELRYAFSKFDLDGSGFISVRELKQVLASIGQNFSENKIANMVASVDKDGDGRLSFEEFRRLIKSN